jgi:hypothetical protein
MSFAGMTERFEAKMDELYAKYSIAGPGQVGLPYSDIKPNDPIRFDLKHDSQFNPHEADKRALNRYKIFLQSPQGQQFMVNQAVLQTGNTFSETRIYNPLFPIGRLPYTTFHVTRPIGTARGNDPTGGSIQSATSAFVQGFTGGLLGGSTVTGDASEMSPGADYLVGGAGRLQQETATIATNKVLLRSGPSGLLNLLPPNKLTLAASAVKNILETGILGVNQRPELNVDGEYFSIALWTGFRRTQSFANAFVQAGAAARKGDIVGAVSQLAKGVSDNLETAVFPTKGSPVPHAARQGRDAPNRPDLDGLRYFIVNKDQADRYLQESIQDGYSNTSYLDRRPYGLSGQSAIELRNVPGAGEQIPTNANQIQASQRKSLASKVGGFLKGATSLLVGSSNAINSVISIGPTSAIGGRLKTGALTNNSSADNPAEERMLFGARSLASRYENATGDVVVFKDETASQKTTWMESVNKLHREASYRIGYMGGIPDGMPVVDDFGIFAMKRTKSHDGRYFSDGAATALNAIITNKDVGDTRDINPELKQYIHDSYHDTIDFMFHDYVNNNIIPFRAILVQLVENVAADYETQRYVGRTEKNIVYSGAARELSFSFFVQAMSESELDYIWQKINYLTGLMFPSDYVDGFMLPPFVQLTIGKFYVDQPGYIRSITHTIEDNTSWDIDADRQMPMGVTVNINYSVIEKTQVRTGASFYGYGTPQLTVPQQTYQPQLANGIQVTNVD